MSPEAVWDCEKPFAPTKTNNVVKAINRNFMSTCLSKLIS
jgi:hypothetical protein